MLGRLFQLLSAQKPSQSPPPPECLLPLCWSPGPTRHLSSLLRAYDPVDTYYGGGQQGTVAIGYPPGAMVIRAEFGVHTPSLRVHSTHLLASGRGLDSPLTPPLQPACIHLQLPSHTHPDLAPHSWFYQDKPQVNLAGGELPSTCHCER